jgi:hypothetical protein
VFGYMNSNWQQEFDIPIGAQNAIEPGGPDQGQPTHFYPRAATHSCSRFASRRISARRN